MAGCVDRYAIVKGHYYRLLQGFKPVLDELAAKLCLVELIDLDSLTGTNTPEEDRSEALLNVILSKIELDNKCFDVLVSVLSKIPELSGLADGLKKALTEEESHSRSVVLLQPLSKTSSVPAEALSTVDRQDSSNVSTSDGEESEFEQLPGILYENQMNLVISPVPAVEMSRSLAVFKPPLPMLSQSGLNCTYTVCSTPLDTEFYDNEANGKSYQEENTAQSECQSSRLEDNVKKLKSQCGIIFSNKDDRIATLTRKVKEINRKVEDLAKNEVEMERQVRQLKDQREAKLSDHPSIETRVSELERCLKQIKTKEKKSKDDAEKLQSELQADQKELSELLSEKKRDISKLIEHFEKRNNQVGVEESTCNPQQATDGEPSQESASYKLHEKPSHKDAMVALLPIADEWKNIGTLLELQNGQLDSIEHQKPKDADCLREMIALWMKTESANWKNLIDAVKRLNAYKASEIEKQYIQQ